MTSGQFMEKLYDLAYEHLKRAGVSIFITAVVTVVLYLRMEKQEVKYESKMTTQDEKHKKEIDSLRIETKVNRQMFADCDVERAVLKAEMKSLKQYVLKRIKQ